MNSRNSTRVNGRRETAPSNTGTKKASRSIRERGVGSKSQTGEDAKKSDLSATGIIKLVEKAEVKLFHTPSGEAFATFYHKGHWETWPMKSISFDNWISAMCYHHSGAVPSQKAITEAKNALAGRAQFNSPECPVHMRLAGHENAIYLDLGNSSWEAVKITPAGWEIASHAPVKFYRAHGMLALPRPVRGGTIEDLREFLNLDGEDQWTLAVSWLVAALRPSGPFPLLIFEGMHGTAKSTNARVLRALVDPNECPLRGEPGSARDLAISAKNSWCLGLDNISSISTSMSDALCRLATGGGFATRALYTDDSEKLFQATRPVLITAIDIGTAREDLLDRALTIVPPPISSELRETELEFWARFELVRPRILGSLLDAISCALRRLPETKLVRKPRMADFATWVTASERAFGWKEGSFLDAYQRNREQSNAAALEASSVFQPLMILLKKGPWSGTMTALLGTLREEQLDLPQLEQQPLPRSANELSALVRRLAPNLSEAGISIEFVQTPGSNSQRLLKITSSHEVSGNESATHASHATQIGPPVCS